MADGGEVTRTELAVERTMLAWWRTALTALAVALAVGRLLPELSSSDTTWPYVVLGLGFAAYAIALLIYGSVRHGGHSGQPSAAVMLTATGGVLLGLATAALIAAT